MPSLRPTVVTILALLLAPLTLAQFPSPVNNDTRTPVPGSGHDYIKMLTETVDPSNGSLSVHISTPVPPSRGITIPFSFDYSSGAVQQVQVCGTSSQGLTSACWAVPNMAGAVLDSGGWSYRIPELTANQKQVTCYYYGGTTGTTDVVFDYMFTDPSGMRHNLGMAHTQALNSNCTYTQQPYNVSTGGDDFYSSTLNQTSGAVTVVGADGTVYSFPTSTFGGGFLVTAWLPSTIEDRNGNIVTISEGGGGNITVKDTAGRAAFSTPGPVGQNGTVSISGLSNGYVVTWEKNSPAYGSQYEQLGNGYNNGCNWLGAGNLANNGAIESIELPNGTYYTFGYDSHGLLNQISYPTGAIVNYTWDTTWANGQIEFFPPYPNNQYECVYGYYAPMVSQRTVKFDGVHTALVQNFSYTTAFGAGVEQATVQTTVYSSDGSTNLGTSKTVYNYSYIPAAGNNDPDDWVIDAAWVPVEQTVQYYDYGQTNLLETVTKAWQDQFLLGCQLDTHDGSGLSGTFYSYGAGGVVTDKKEYDYSQINGTNECPQAAQGGPITAPSSPTPLRETTATYQAFADTPIFPTAPSILDRPCSVVVKDSHGNPASETDYQYDGGTSVCGTAGTASVASASNPVQHDSAYGYNAPTQPPRGNLTTATRLCLQGCGSPSVTKYAYDETGQVSSMTDPCGNTVCGDMVNGTNHTTRYSYADSYTSGTTPGNTDSYLTKITRPETNGVPHVESFSYSYADGQLTQSVDENNQSTTYKYNTPPSGCTSPDGLDRLSEIDYPNTGRTTYCYNDTPPSPTITTTKTMNPSQSITSVSTMDGLGHVVQTQLDDPQGTITTSTQFQGLGSPFHVYNPYRSASDPTYGYTAYVYDALGRTKQVVEPDGGPVSTTYSGTCTTVTDEASKSRESCSDALGQLKQVFEDPSGLNWETDYTYDGLSDLVSVVQGGQRPRSFTYDSLGRLTQSVNPEAGTINYVDDANGNVETKTAPAPNQSSSQTVTTNYQYDPLNRLSAETYTNGDPSLTYSYDQSACLDEPSCYNIGHRTTMTDAGGTEYFAYDVMGHEIADQRTTSGITKRSTYLYDYVGDLTQAAYPSGRVVNYTFDSAGRPSTAQDAQTSTYYATGPCMSGGSSNGVCYAPQGGVSEVQNGSNLLTGYIYNTRLQPCWIYATTNGALPTACSSSDPGSGNILDLQYCFYTWVNGACEASTTNNGDVIAIANNRDSTRTQNFSYDSVNRLASAQTASTSGTNCWGETYTYDEWANLTGIGSVSGYTGCTQEFLSVSANSNNQLSGLSYDAAGNVLYDGTHTYVWNAANELTSAAGLNYTYDGDSNRLEKSSGKIYWYGPGGEVLDESDGNGNITDEYIFFGGKRIAHITGY